MSKESLWLVETGGGTGLKITSEPLTERKPVGSDGRSRYRASLSGRKAKRVVPQRFSPLSLYRDKGVFYFAPHPRAPSTGGSAKRWGLRWDIIASIERNNVGIDTTPRHFVPPP